MYLTPSERQKQRIRSLKFHNFLIFLMFSTGYIISAGIFAAFSAAFFTLSINVIIRLL